MPREVSLTSVQLVALVVAAIVAGSVGAMVLGDASTAPRDRPYGSDDPEIDTFDSAEEFRSYLQAGERRHARGGTLRAGARTGGDAARARESVDVATDGPADDAAGAPAGTPMEAEASGGFGAGDGEGERRASDTNVQVEGIDEPDVLKTTSDTLYYSAAPGDRRVRRHDDTVSGADSGVRLIDADDPAAPEVASRLDVSGELLLAGDTLVVFEDDRLVGYDVSDRGDPERAWSKELSDRMVTARLHAGTVYLVTADGIDREDPCPVRPMEDVSVPCTGVHHPAEPMPVDTTYTVALLDPARGSVEDATSFVATSDRRHRGPGSGTVVYASADGVYVAYPEPVDEADLMAEFLLETQTDRLDDATLERVRQIRRYDLSPRAQRIELMHAVETWLAGLDPAERREAERALSEDRREWAEANKREFARTGIVAFEVSGAGSASPSVRTGATGSVPGYALNQFSLDERDGQFRIATTVPRTMGVESENDLYVLDAATLEEVGSVQGMGITERIYSVRYVGDEAYVVTYRQIDPFHVVDLSEPADPTVRGELKLPGFSSYLHPLSDDRVLGIGEEDGKVKLVVFDVSDPGNPTVEEDRILDARWSGVSESHHAFLLDRRHEVFFLPTDGTTHRPRPTPEVDDERTGGGDEDVHTGGVGYVFSYEEGLEVETTVETPGRTRRAAYVGDHMYVFGESSVTVVDQNTWSETGTVEFSED